MSPRTALRGRPDAGESLGISEDDAAVGVVLAVGLVLAQDRELDAVDGQELVEGQAEGDGGEDVDLDEGLPAGVVGAEGVFPPPFGSEGGEVVGQSGIVAGPGVGAERGEGGHGFRGVGAVVGGTGRFVRRRRASGVTRSVSAGSSVGVAGRFVRRRRAAGVASRVPAGHRGVSGAASRIRAAGGDGVSGIRSGVPTGGAAGVPGVAAQSG